MKKVLLFLIVIATVACKKEEPIPSQTPLWVKFDEEEQPFNTKTILNPIPTPESLDGSLSSYRFYFSNSTYPDLKIEIRRRSNSSSTSFDSTFLIGVEVYEAVVEKQLDGHYITGNYDPPGSGNRDSIYHLSFGSSIVSPFTDTSVYEEVYWNDSRFFSTNRSINLLDTSLLWDDKADINPISTPFGSNFCFFRDYFLQEYHTGSDGTFFQVTNDYHKGLLGKGHKIFVFRWFNRNSATGYYYGWMEISLTENREFTIHKVVYQVD